MITLIIRGLKKKNIVSNSVRMHCLASLISKFSQQFQLHFKLHENTSFGVLAINISSCSNFQNINSNSGHPLRDVRAYITSKKYGVRLKFRPWKSQGIPVFQVSVCTVQRPRFHWNKQFHPKKTTSNSVNMHHLESLLLKLPQQFQLQIASECTV